jgi:hypothetical protein
MTTTIDAAVILSEDDWSAAFQPITNPRDETLLFDWTEALDANFLNNVDVHHVWTEVDDDDSEDTLILPGMHRVNRIGYLITLAPWRDDEADLAVVCDGPDDLPFTTVQRQD